MAQSSVTSTILSILEDHEPQTPMDVGTIIDGVSERYKESDRVPEDNEIRGRLTQLYKEGIVDRPARGEYLLVQAEPDETEELASLVDIVANILRPEELRRTVLWDATPYLQRTEDGAPGTRLVVEHEQAPAFRDEVDVAWPETSPVATWAAETTGPVGPLLWEPAESMPYRTSTGIVFVERAKFGATGVTPQGYRTPFQERAVVEFLGEDGPAEAAPLVRTLLNDASTEYDRLWQAAESLGESVALGTVLAGLGDSLQPKLRTQLLDDLPPVSRTLLGGNR